MRIRYAVYAALSVAAGLFLLLQPLCAARRHYGDVALARLPACGMTPSGRVRYWVAEGPEFLSGPWLTEDGAVVYPPIGQTFARHMALTELDAARRPLAMWIRGPGLMLPPAEYPDKACTVRATPWRAAPGSGWDRLVGGEPLRFEAAASIAYHLTMRERGTEAGRWRAWIAREGRVLLFDGPPTEAEYGDWRLHRAQQDDADPAGGFGTDGYAAGRAALDREPFHGAALLHVAEGRLLVLDPSGRRLLAITHDPAASDGEALVTIRESALAGRRGEAPSLLAAAGSARWLIRLGDEVAVVDPEGAVLGRLPWDPATDRLRRMPLSGRAAVDGIHANESGTHLVTDMAPYSPTHLRVRMRLFPPEGAPVMGEVDLYPITPQERRIELLLGALTLLRPPILNAVAHFSAPPDTREEMLLWWWRDPFLAQDHRGWLLASAAIGALCALVAWRIARRRCPTMAGVRFWSLASLLLGPLGLAWMRVAMPWHAIEDGRAVNLDSSPATDAPWPEPEPTRPQVIA